MVGWSVAVGALVGCLVELRVIPVERLGNFLQLLVHRTHQKRGVTNGTITRPHRASLPEIGSVVLGALSDHAEQNLGSRLDPGEQFGLSGRGYAKRTKLGRPGCCLWPGRSCQQAGRRRIRRSGRSGWHVARNLIVALAEVFRALGQVVLAGESHGRGPSTPAIVRMGPRWPCRANSSCSLHPLPQEAWT